MNADKRPKGNWRLLLVGVFLGSVITAGAFLVFPSDFNKAKNVNWGFGETKVITTNTETDRQGQVVKITESEQTKPGKTFWDWLELIIRSSLVPLVIFILGRQFQKRDKEKEKDNLAEEAIEAYLKSMADILLNEELTKKLKPETTDDNKSNSSDKDNAVRDVARALTIAILRKLEGDRRRQDVIFRFLRDAELHKFILKNAHLSEMDLSGTSLWDIDLSGARLREADLPRANLNQANLSGAKLQEAILKEADLKKAILKEADLERAVLKQAKNLTPKQIKSAHNWQQAIYIGEFNQEKKIWEPIESDNKKFTEYLENNKSLDQEKPVNWSTWKNNNST